MFHTLKAGFLYSSFDGENIEDVGDIKVGDSITSDKELILP
jgi:hypothetical protein